MRIKISTTARTIVCSTLASRLSLKGKSSSGWTMKIVNLFPSGIKKCIFLGKQEALCSRGLVHYNNTVKGREITITLYQRISFTKSSIARRLPRFDEIRRVQHMTARTDTFVKSNLDPLHSPTADSFERRHGRYPPRNTRSTTMLVANKAKDTSHIIHQLSSKARMITCHTSKYTIKGPPNLV
jgi:hypothetical protein